MNNGSWRDKIEKIGVLVSCVVKQGDKYLMVKEEPYGKLVHNPPTGHVDIGETLESAAIRETKEETGYDIRLKGQIGLYHETAQQPVKHVFQAEVIGGHEQAQAGEIIEVLWLTLDEIKALNEADKLRDPWVWDAISSFKS